MDREAFWSHLYDWIVGSFEGHPFGQRPYTVGLSAPQGAGKSTMMTYLCQMAADVGIRAATVSVDDFYLTHRELVDLASRHPDNPYFRHRGYPGTHDVNLGTRTLRALKNIHSLGAVDVPAYDRSAFSGKGDRRPSSGWPRVTAPLDILIFEGWLLGFRPVAPAALPNRHFLAVNDYLAAYSNWVTFLDAFIWLEPLDPHFVIEWRIEAEEQAKASGRVGMEAGEVDAFVRAFLPAYDTYLSGLGGEPLIPGPALRILIGRDRLPVGREL